MSDSVTWTVCEKVVDLLNAFTGFPAGNLSIVRKVVPKFDKKDLENTLVVCVTPRPAERERITRTLVDEKIMVDIGVIKELNKKTFDADVNKYMAVCEDVAAYMDKKDPGVTGVQFIMSEYDPHFAADHVQKENFFVGVVTVEYKKLIG